MNLLLLATAVAGAAHSGSVVLHDHHVHDVVGEDRWQISNAECQ